MDEKTDAPDETEPPEPPPFDPDPDLIAYLEGGDKPKREEIRELTER